MHTRILISIIQLLFRRLTLMVALLFVIGRPVAAVAGEEVEILDLRRTTDGAGMELVFQSDSAGYYEVWQATEGTSDWVLVDIILGTGTVQTWVDSSIDGVAARYYQLVQRSLSDPGDADGDGIDDVYELTHDGLSPLTPDTVVVQLISVAAERIAAGAIASAPHQTSVTLHTTPPAAVPVSVWLIGGAGDGGRSAAGAATLTSNEQVFVAGSDSSDQNPIVVSTNTDGSAVLVLTSSNKINEQCVVHARVGTAGGLANSEAQSPPVTFELGDLEVDFPRTLMSRFDALATVKRMYNGMPLSGHETRIFVRQIRSNGQVFTTDWEHSDELADYAALRPIEGPQRTDENGEMTASVFIRHGVSVDFVEVQAIDLQVHK